MYSFDLPLDNMVVTSKQLLKIFTEFVLSMFWLTGYQVISYLIDWCLLIQSFLIIFRIYSYFIKKFLKNVNNDF